MKELVLRSLWVFFAMVVLDLLWAVYVITTNDREVIAAPTIAAIIILITGFITRSYVVDKRMLIPAALGAFVGTYIAMVTM